MNNKKTCICNCTSYVIYHLGKIVVIIEILCKTQRNTPPLEIPCDHFSSQPIRVFILSTISAQDYRGAEWIVKPWLAKMIRPG